MALTAFAFGALLALGALEALLKLASTLLWLTTAALSAVTHNKRIAAATRRIIMMRLLNKLLLEER